MLVDEWEEGIKEPLHKLINAELRPQKKEADVSEELSDCAHSMISHVRVGHMEDGVGVVLSLPDQDLKGFCGIQDKEEEKKRDGGLFKYSKKNCFPFSRRAAG